ncbi:hypothetical protein TSAR_003092, partial [Trichomalopsis sarcophagae]
MELQKKQQLPRQSRLRSRSTCGSEDYFEAPKKKAVNSYNKFQKPNNTEFSDAATKALKALKENLRRQIAAKAAEKQPPRRSRSRSSDGSKEQRRGVMELQGKQPTRQSRPRSRSPDGSKQQRRGVMELEGGQPTRQSRPRSRSPDGSKDQRRKVMDLKKNTTSAVQSLGSPEFRVRIPESQRYLTTEINISQNYAGLPLHDHDKDNNEDAYVSRDAEGENRVDGDANRVAERENRDNSNVNRDAEGENRADGDANRVAERENRDDRDGNRNDGNRNMNDR